MAEKTDCKCDPHVNKMMEYVTEQIADFIAFLFVLFSLGAIYGWWIISKVPHLTAELLFVPLALAVVAYYNRDFAAIIFTVVIALIIIF